MIGKQFVGPLLFLAFTGVLTVCLGESKSVPAEGQHRLYTDGPLQISDFQAKQPTSSRFSAYSAVRVHFRHRYRSQIQNDQTTVQVDSINVFSVFVRDQSWFTPRTDKQLLDHEQGHFDIAEASARRAQLRLNAMFDRDGPLTAIGQTQSVAARRLSRKIEQLIRPFTDHAISASQEYDRITHHGSFLRIQAEQRRIQKATLNRLTQQLEKSRNSAQHAKQKPGPATGED